MYFREVYSFRLRVEIQAKLVLKLFDILSYCIAIKDRS